MPTPPARQRARSGSVGSSGWWRKLLLLQSGWGHHFSGQKLLHHLGGWEDYTTDTEERLADKFTHVFVVKSWERLTRPAVPEPRVSILPRRVHSWVPGTETRELTSRLWKKCHNHATDAVLRASQVFQLKQLQEWLILVLVLYIQNKSQKCRSETVSSVPHDRDAYVNKSKFMYFDLFVEEGWGASGVLSNVSHTTYNPPQSLSCDSQLSIGISNPGERNEGSQTPGAQAFFCTSDVYQDLITSVASFLHLTHERN